MTNREYCENYFCYFTVFNTNFFAITWFEQKTLLRLIYWKKIEELGRKIFQFKVSRRQDFASSSKQLRELYNYKFQKKQPQIRPRTIKSRFN